MSADTSESAIPTQVLPIQDAGAEAITQGVAALALPELEDPPPPHTFTDLTPRPLVVYTRSQILSLHKSPLVSVPEGMPPLKDWFGTENEQLASRKEGELSSAGNNGRDRRFRRDGEDSASSRLSFRGNAVTQPSQMGNFKHQSIRTTDRDRDKDADREQDKETRARENQERIRNLSDKYDRDRRALSSALRGKERDQAPHLGASASSRAVSAGQQPPRDPSKKKDGDFSDDWRRGGDTSRPSQGERADGRRDRDERARSRIRDSSRSRNETSIGRRERDNYFKEGRRDRDDPREKDDQDDDSRKWRDDGKRDDRLAARRDREHPRGDKNTPASESNDRQDRRWAGDDRDSRNKRNLAKDRKPGALDEGKDSDRRDRDKDRDREREKEPAWMETYIPSDGANTFLGQGATGEVDGIQAFKREQRQKERKDASVDVSPGSFAEPSKLAPDSSMANASESHLDEIQLFKLMMKREEERKGSDPIPLETPSDPMLTNKPPAVASSESAILAGFGAIRPPKSESPALMNPRNIIQSGSPLSRIQSTEPRPPIQPSAEAAGSRFFPSLLAEQPLNPPAARGLNTDAQSNQSVGPRLLALGSRPSQTSISPLPAPQRPSSRSPAPLQNTSINSNKLSGQRTPDLGFPNTIVHGDTGMLPSLSPNLAGGIQAMRSGPGMSNMDRSAFLQSDLRQMHGLGTSPHDSVPGLGGTAAKGSRFAKFFDEKAREAHVSVNKQEQLLGGAPIALHQRQDIGGNGAHADARAMEDIFAMLNQSAQQGTRLHPAQDTHILDARYFKGHANGSMANQQMAPNFQGNHSRLDSLYDSRMDDKNFVPDGLVPGLRTAPPRTRQNNAVYSDLMEDAAQLNVQRGAHQQRLFEQMYANSNQSMYGHQHGIGRGNNALLPQQAQLRGVPSPNSLPNDGQRLPPGLANLGGRPPHDGNFVPQHMLAPGNMNGPLQGNPGPPPYGNFPPNGNSFGAQIRAPHPGHQLPNPPHNQAQLHGLTGNSGLPGAVRGSGGLGQQNHQAQGPGPMLGMRQQPQQQIPPHMLSQMLPPHLQHQAMSAPNNHPAHDLMALLMGGGRRE